jgi:CBS domain-containing protein
VKNLTVADVMTTDVLKARPGMPVRELARVLVEHHVSALPVLDEVDRLVGVVSERDVLLKQGHQIPRRPRWWETGRAREDIRRAAGGTAGQLMSRPAVTIGPEATLAQAARLMTDRGVKRLPVVDGHGALLGIVSRADLMKVFLRTDDEIRGEILGEVFVHLLWADPMDVDVAVRDGVVTLTGTVRDRSTAEVAGRLVRRLDGVVDVVSELEFRVDDGGLARRR